MTGSYFVDLKEWNADQLLADCSVSTSLYRNLDEVEVQFCPVLRHFRTGYHREVLLVPISEMV